VLTVPALLAMAQSPAPRQPAAAPAVPRAEKTPYVSVRLLPERTHVRGGEEIWIGIEQSIHPGWHTYWKNPGDSGSQPRINWTLPDGFKTREIAWPMPKKLPYGDLLNYGYENNAILLQKLRIPSSLPPGR